MGARRVFRGTGVISAPLTGVTSFEIQSGVFSPKVLYKDRRLLIPLDEAEGTRGKHALMVTPTRASPSHPTSASAAAWCRLILFPRGRYNQQVWK
jgi:hypothetical protein